MPVTAAVPDPGADAAPVIDSHGQGDLIWIDMILVPRHLRGQGLGRTAYETWEANLPKTVTLVLLLAADTGSGSSAGFWEAMGYDYRYDGENLGYEAEITMWKGVNGQPTPATLKVDEDDGHAPEDDGV